MEPHESLTALTKIVCCSHRSRRLKVCWCHRCAPLWRCEHISASSEHQGERSSGVHQIRTFCSQPCPDEKIQSCSFGSLTGSTVSDLNVMETSSSSIFSVRVASLSLMMRPPGAPDVYLPPHPSAGNPNMRNKHQLTSNQLHLLSLSPAQRWRIPVRSAAFL